MVAQTKLDVLFVDVKNFFYFFTDSELKRMMNQVVPINMADIQERVQGNFYNLKVTSKRVLNGLNCNVVENTAAKDQARYLSPEEKNVKTLAPWL